jgi:hypothetical protein
VFVTLSDFLVRVAVLHGSGPKIIRNIFCFLGGGLLSLFHEKSGTDMLKNSTFS